VKVAGAGRAPRQASELDDLDGTAKRCEGLGLTLGNKPRPGPAGEGLADLDRHRLVAAAQSGHEAKDFAARRNAVSHRVAMHDYADAIVDLNAQALPEARQPCLPKGGNGLAQRAGQAGLCQAAGDGEAFRPAPDVGRHGPARRVQEAGIERNPSNNLAGCKTLNV
jgi:hypothetical protein